MTSRIRLRPGRPRWPATTRLSPATRGSCVSRWILSFRIATDRHRLLGQPADLDGLSALLERLRRGGLVVLSDSLKLSSPLQLHLVARHGPGVGDVANHAALDDQAV